MNPLAEFIKLNELEQKDLANFWNVTESYVSRLCSGHQKLPRERKSQLLGNPFGWDTSPLEAKVVQTIDNTTVGDNSCNIHIIGENESLKREVELLKQLLEEKERTIQILLNK